METLNEVLEHCNKRRCIGCPWMNKGTAVECFDALVKEVYKILKGENNETE